MRDRRGNRDLSPKFRLPRRDRDRRADPREVSPPRFRHHHHHHVDRRGAVRNPAPRLVRVSLSPPPARALPPPPHVRRDYLSPPPVHHHHLRRPLPHSPPVVREYRRDLHVFPEDCLTDLQPHGYDPLPVCEPLFPEERLRRPYPPAPFDQDLIVDTMLPDSIRDSSLHHRHGLARAYYDEGRDRDREMERGRDRVRDRHRERVRVRDRETGKGLYQRDLPHTATGVNNNNNTTQLGPIEVGQSSYGRGGRLRYNGGDDDDDDELAAPEDASARVPLIRSPDGLRTSRERLGGGYDKLLLGEVYEKKPYQSIEFTRVDAGVGFSPKSVREDNRLYDDVVHHYEHRHEYSPLRNGYGDGDDLVYETDVHNHDHDHDLRIYDDRIFEDNYDNIENDEYGDDVGYAPNTRIPVKDRLNMPPPLDVDRPIQRRAPAAPYRKPLSAHGKPYHQHYKMPPPHAAMRTNSVKKRIRSGPSDPRNENFRANKIQRRGGTDYDPNIGKVAAAAAANGNGYEKGGGSDENAAGIISPVLRMDPPEGSEEFNREVEKAFFKYAKVINEDGKEKEKLQHGKGSFSCYICRRNAKDFAETHNLVVHTFHTKKLRTAHLGLHKALCLLMGWNWLITPDESKQYQLGLPSEAKILKQDLILWPPLVIIRNGYVECNNNDNASETKSVGVDVIQSMLKELGIGEEDAKVSYGKPSNQSVISVKFNPYGSGFELAEKLHDHFYQANHGKEHLYDLHKSATCSKNYTSDDKEIHEVLYGYLAGIEDLEYLDSDTKKIYLAGKETIRSKKAIKNYYN